MWLRGHQRFAAVMACVAVGILGLASPGPRDARAQTVTDGSDAAIGKEDARQILALAASYLEKKSDPKITALRRAQGATKGATTGAIICGTVDVKGKDGRYLGERGFIADLSIPSFARVPEGVELLDPRAVGFEEKERVRQQYFAMCLD